jgi:hypothetical protein
MEGAGQEPPAYLAQRVEEGEGAALPEVEVGDGEFEGKGWLRSGRKKRGVVVEEASVREAVMRHAVEGLRGELVRELMELVVG